MWASWDDFMQTANRGGFSFTDLLGQKFRNVFDLSFSGGIKFPATQIPSADPNTLDDYEEGSWTPSDASGAALTLTTPTGTYTKIGNIVIATGSFTYPVTANGAAAGIGGFPFTCANVQEARGGGLTFHNGATAVKFIILNNATSGSFYTAAGVAVTNAQMSTTLSYTQVIYRV